MWAHMKTVVISTETSSPGPYAFTYGLFSSGGSGVHIRLHGLLLVIAFTASFE